VRLRSRRCNTGNSYTAMREIIHFTTGYSHGRTYTIRTVSHNQSTIPERGLKDGRRLKTTFVKCISFRQVSSDYSKNKD